MGINRFVSARIFRELRLTRPGLAQLFVGGTLANLVGRLWALRISIATMIIGVYDLLTF
jgi:hypothetical protein